MRNQTILLALLAALTASGCQMIECADGTIERDGKCMPGEDGIVTKCGPFTELQGDQCVPQFPPTVCESGAESIVDEETGVTTCLGGGIPNCGASLPCPKPSGATKQTFCGQLYNFENNTPIGDPAGTPGEECGPASTALPCKLQVLAYDALVFARNPSATTPLPVGEPAFIDNCGRFRLRDVEVGGAGPFIGIGVDDASGLSPTGETVTVAVATSNRPNTATNNIEHWIVPLATVTAWGGPPLSGGIYAPVYRQHKLGNGDPFALQSGVSVTKSGSVMASIDYYFSDADANRTMIGAGAATGPNGTALITGAVADDGLVYGGQGGLGPGCRWDPHAGASLEGIVFIQIFRKLDVLGQTCMD